MESRTKKILVRNLIIIAIMALAILLLCSCTTIYPILGYAPSRLGDLNGESNVIGQLPNGNYLVTPGLVKEYINLCVREISYDNDFPSQISPYTIAEAKTMGFIVQKHESKYWQEFDYEGVTWEVYPAMVNHVKG